MKNNGRLARLEQAENERQAQADNELLRKLQIVVDRLNSGDDDPGLRQIGEILATAKRRYDAQQQQTHKA